MTIQGIRLACTKRMDDPEGNIRYMLDQSVLSREVLNVLSITGWVVHRKHNILNVSLVAGKDTLATAKLDIHRPGVSQHFLYFHNSESAGFNLLSSTLPKGKFRLNIELENRKIVPIAEFELVAFEQPRLLFMHIAKAAGSTVNTFFASHYAPSLYAVHLESNKKWQTLPAEFKKLHFLSGHVSLYVLDKKLTLADYYKVTVVREPYAQLRSHLTWIKRLSMLGEEQRFEQHPTYIQKFSAKLAKTDFADPQALKNLLGSLEDIEMRLLDNCQVRYFTWIPPGKAVGAGDAKKAIKVSGGFDRIGTSESIADFLKSVANDMSWPKPENFARKNVTQNFYGLDIADKQTRGSLKPLVQHDQVLYEFIKKSSHPAD